MSKKRWTLIVVLIAMSMACLVSVMRMRAANPTSGMISPGSPPLAWNGTAAGGTNNGEATCVEGVNCDTFTLTVSGRPATGRERSSRSISRGWCSRAITTSTSIRTAMPGRSSIVRDGARLPRAKLPRSSRATRWRWQTVFTIRVGLFRRHGGRSISRPCDRRFERNCRRPPPAPPPLTNWKIVYHGTCCEGNLARRATIPSSSCLCS